MASFEDKIADGDPWYTNRQLKYSYTWARHVYESRISFIRLALERINKRTKRLLEVGCGDGSNLYRLARSGMRGLELYGIDYNPLRVSRASRMLRGVTLEVVRVGDNWTSPVESGFDIILLSHVLEHIPDDRGALQWLHRYLADDGFLILMVPNEDCLMLRVSRALRPFAETDHIHFYTMNRLSRLLELSNWNCVLYQVEPFAVPEFHLRMLAISFWPTYQILKTLGNRFPSQASGLQLLCTPQNSRSKNHLP